MMNYFKLSLQIITYHIYHDGRIERHVPAELLLESEKRYEYIYHDKNNNVHNIGVFNYREIKNKHLDNKKRYGDMEYIHLINLNEVTQEYSKLGLTYRFNVDSNDDDRFFMNRDTLASFFGALFEVGFKDISCNGFSTMYGESGGSKSHFNGYHGDFKFLRFDEELFKGNGTSLSIRDYPELFDPKRQNQWNDALYKFGWTNMLGWSYTIDGVKKFPNHITKETENHWHHLHVQFYDMKKVKEIKQ